MSTLHVVGKNLQLWLCIHATGIGEKYILITLVSISFLRQLSYKYFSIEYTCCIIVQYAFIQFIAQAIGLDIVNDGVIVDMAMSGLKIEAVKMSLAIFCIE